MHFQAITFVCNTGLHVRAVGYSVDQYPASYLLTLLPFPIVW